MSAEAPRNNGTGELIPPRRPEGGFSGFFRKLFAVPPTTPKLQPPSGLEDFAAKIQQGIDEQLTVRNQQELERKKAEVVRMTAETTRRLEAEQRQRDLIEQERVERKQSTREATEILRDFRVYERLKHIQQAVWEGKGQIWPIKPQFSSEKNKTDMLVGLELIHHFPSVTREEAGDPPYRSGRSYRWRNVPVTGSMQLSIRVLRISKSLDIDKKVIVVSDDTIPPLWMPIRGVIIPLDADSEGLLKESLIADSLDRVSGYGLPSQRERQGRERLAEAKRSEGWMKWIQVSEPEVAD